MWFLRYASGQTDINTYRHADCNTLHLFKGQSINAEKCLFTQKLIVVVVAVQLYKFIVVCPVLLQSRELTITIVWKDDRRMCAVKFLRLEDFLYDRPHDQALVLEPQGVLFADVCDRIYLTD